MRNPAQAVRALLSPPGTQHSFHLARELDRQGCLESFYTGIALHSKSGISSLLSKVAPAIRRRLASRMLPPDFASTVHRRVAIELLALWRLRRGMEDQTVMHSRNEAFQRSISDEALREADAIIGVDTASWILAARAKRLGRPFFLDQSIGHPDAKQAMHDKMRSRFPSWTEGFESRRPEVREAELAEQKDATVIVTASRFAKQTLVQSGIPDQKVTVIPYGVDCRFFQVVSRRSERPFRFIFLGLVTARKGAPLLIEAWRKLSATDAELWLAGSASVKARASIPELPGLFVKGSVPRENVPSLLQQCDVLVFPSFFEGFGLVILEAMACGLPVITTTATGGPDIISNGQDGWITEAGSLEQLVSVMQFCLDNRKSVSDMGAKARETAERFSWKVYGDRWAELLEQVRLAVRC